MIGRAVVERANGAEESVLEKDKQRDDLRTNKSQSDHKQVERTSCTCTILPYVMSPTMASSGRRERLCGQEKKYIS